MKTHCTDIKLSAIGELAQFELDRLDDYRTLRIANQTGPDQVDDFGDGWGEVTALEEPVREEGLLAQPPRAHQQFGSTTKYSGLGSSYSELEDIVNRAFNLHTHEDETPETERVTKDITTRRRKKEKEVNTVVSQYTVEGQHDTSFVLRPERRPSIGVLQARRSDQGSISQRQVLVSRINRTRGHLGRTKSSTHTVKSKVISGHNHILCLAERPRLPHRELHERRELDGQHYGGK